MSTHLINTGDAAANCLDRRHASKSAAASPFGYARDFLENHFVYIAISPRARGLSIGVNVNPDADCNFGCLYCEVDRTVPRPPQVIDCDRAAVELERTLDLVHRNALKNRPPYSALPDELLRLRHVALSGDGEPTASPRFRDAVEMVVHIRARAKFPFFKIVLITNASFLGSAEVQSALGMFTARDEIWAKLDAGTQEYFELVNRGNVPLQKILANILLTARKRPVIIQSLFSSIDSFAPPTREITEYANRLRELKENGAHIDQVQIYSATRPTDSLRVGHLPLRTMSEIAAAVRNVAGLRAEVF